MLGTIWLKTSNKIIEKIIINLSQKYKTPIFTPHITLINGFLVDDIDFIINIVKEIKLNLKKISLKIKDINFSDILTKTLYLTFCENNDLKRLRIKSENIFYDNKIAFNKDFNPHLSLIYDFLNEKEKKDLALKIKNQLPNELLFDDLILVLEEKPIEKPMDVSKWKYINF